MGFLAPLSSGRFQRLMFLVGRNLAPWHCLGLDNCLLIGMIEVSYPLLFPRIAGK